MIKILERYLHLAILLNWRLHRRCFPKIFFRQATLQDTGEALLLKTGGQQRNLFLDETVRESFLDHSLATLRAKYFLVGHTIKYRD